MAKNKKITDELEESIGLNEDILENLPINDSGAEEKKSDFGESENVSMPKSKLVLIKKLLSNINENSARLKELLSVFITEEDEARINVSQLSEEVSGEDNEKAEEGRIIEGVFDGENMIGPDGKQYSVPANYASKSKLVEGDILKLTITDRGTFIYKQISPIERTRIIGVLEKAPDGNFYTIADSRKWRVLTASVTYFKGEQGDEIVIIVPKTGESKWAAVENIIKNPNTEIL